MSTQGRKDDGGKLRWDLLPLPLVEKLVEIYEFGARKYGENNWRTIKDGYRRCKAAFFRHLTAYDKGELNDPESGKSHLMHCAWNALSMVYFAEEDNNKQAIPNTDFKLAVKRYNDRGDREFLCIDGKMYVFDACTHLILKRADVLSKAREATLEEHNEAMELFEDPIVSKSNNL